MLIGVDIEHMMPAWDTFTQNNSHKIQIYKCNIDSNAHLTQTLKGFPTIRLYKTDGSSVDYEGDDRTVNAFETFINDYVN